MKKYLVIMLFLSLVLLLGVGFVSASPDVFVTVGNSGQVGYSSDGVSWTDGGTSTFSNNLWDVAWSPELELFVAVGGSGQLGYSSDGVSWTDGGTSTYSNILWGVAWSPELELFVTVGNSGQVGYSSDGVNWTDGGTSTFSNTLYGVAWSPELELFVTVGTSGQVGYSSDGVSWTDGGTSTFSNSLNSVAWSPELELFVAVGQSGQVGYSSDGVSWTDGGTSTFSNSLNSVAWSPELELFVAVGQNGQVGYSSDGVSWTDGSTSTFSNTLRGVAWSLEAPTSSNFTVTAIDDVTLNPINNFSLQAIDSNNISDVRTFSTTNGAIITNITDDMGEWDLTISSSGYYDREYLSNNVSTNLEAELTPITYFTVTNITANITNVTILDYSITMTPMGQGPTRNFATTNGTIITDIENVGSQEYDITLSSDGYIEREYLSYDAFNNLENQVLNVQDSLLISLFDDITIPVGNTETLNLDNNMLSYRYEVEVYYLDTLLQGEGVTLGESTGIYTETTNRFKIILENNILNITPLTQSHSFDIRVIGYNINDEEGDSYRFNIISTTPPVPQDSLTHLPFDMDGESNIAFYMFIFITTILLAGTLFLKGMNIGYIGGLWFLVWSVILMSNNVHIIYIAVMWVLSAASIMWESQY